MGNLESKKGRVLVVEDSADLRLFISIILKRENYEVIPVASGEEALDAIENLECPDLILLDLTLSKMTGLEFIKKIKVHPKCPNVKIVIVSGWDDLKRRADDVKADGFLKKPIDLDSLIKEVSRHI